MMNPRLLILFCQFHFKKGEFKTIKFFSAVSRFVFPIADEWHQATCRMTNENFPRQLPRKLYDEELSSGFQKGNGSWSG